MSPTRGYTFGMRTDDLFGPLVDNALDFLSRSVRDLERSPKYSVIHFHAAVELFVKARLMAEHWSLVVAKGKDPDWEKFVAGDFKSVSLGEAADRLEKVVRSGISKPALQSFRNVGNHRNKMVHFFHEAHSDTEDGNLRTGIAKEQLNAWYLLHQLLTVQWKDVFGAWLPQIGDMDTKLREHRKYLQVVFDHARPRIREREREGLTFDLCPSCRFRAQERNPAVEDIDVAVCLVCGLEQKRLTIECPACGEPVEFVDEGFSECDSCGKSLEPEHVVEALKDHGAAYAAAKEGDRSWEEGNCAECGVPHTVVRTASGGYVCASCFGDFESLQECEWCDEPNTGDMENSYLMGCSVCEGRSGWGD